MRELPKDIDEPDVASLLARMAPVDIVLLDGFRRSDYPKMEVVQAGQERAQFAANDPDGARRHVRGAGNGVGAPACR